MQVFVKCLGQNTITVDIPCKSSSDELKGILQEKTGIVSKDQLLFYCNRPLNGCSLEEMGITSLSTISMTQKLLGGVLSENTRALAMSYQNIKICRKCYCRNGANATHCRNQKCGHCADLRPKKKRRDKK
ncbi:ribosomal protein L40 [Hamiltosporidium tvaerminnensis]|uniref:Ribosomal protein L40 n=1 Tax=Hamiltosporidium tvaerminnensis TaxID=1176355 RepID=A0A4Q9LA16_9MICR|nr:ribosomal protein L40 [Hamiltosporidium tvaerminnensis]